MRTLQAPATAVTPQLVFAPGEHRLSLEGECYPENPLPFFNPLLAALHQYFEQQRPAQFVAQFKLQYINSASTMGLRSLFALLDQAAHQGSGVRVLWCYDAEDDAMEELGADLVEDFANLVLERQTYHA